MTANDATKGYADMDTVSMQEAAGAFSGRATSLVQSSPNGRLFSVVLHLRALEAAEIPATGGHLSHALFLSLIEGVDPALAARLHDEPGYRPFTVSALNGPLHPSRERAGYVRLQPGALYWLRFTLLQPEVWQGFMKTVMLATPVTGLPTPRYGAARFGILRVLATLDASAGFGTVQANGVRTAQPPVWAAWPGSCTWSDLAARSGLRQVREVTAVNSHPSNKEGRSGIVRISLRFYSPTAFSLPVRAAIAPTDDNSNNQQPDTDEVSGWSKKGGKRMELWPRPELVFGSLARTWTLYSPLLLPVGRDDLERMVASEVVVSRYDLQTQMLQFPRHKQVGFVGNVVYECMEGGKLAPILETLADFALYAGIGYKTGMGMGQARRVVGEGA